jgi:hypothetical protein
MKKNKFTLEERKRGYDEVYLARLSRNLSEMLKVVDLETTIMNRHFLLQGIVEQTYKLRKVKHYNDLCLEFCEKHLSELPSLIEALKDEFGGLPIILTFQNHSTILTEIGEYDKAIKICENAISLGLEDGTKGGYQGRIDKIKKKMISK